MSDTTRNLSPELALELVSLMRQSTNWLLAPAFDGCFDDMDEAERYVNDNKGHPLMLIAPLLSGDYSESLMVSSDVNGRIHLIDDSMGGYSGSADDMGGAIKEAKRIFNLQLGERASAF